MMVVAGVMVVSNHWMMMTSWSNPFGSCMAKWSAIAPGRMWIRWARIVSSRSSVCLKAVSFFIGATGPRGWLQAFYHYVVAYNNHLPLGLEQDL